MTQSSKNSYVIRMRRKERWQRRKLKAEIGALTEQADAYEDTLMIFAVRKHESDKDLLG
mgnify:CR=1 FL=1